MDQVGYYSKNINLIGMRALPGSFEDIQNFLTGISFLPNLSHLEFEYLKYKTTLFDI